MKSVRFSRAAGRRWMSHHKRLAALTVVIAVVTTFQIPRGFLTRCYSGLAQDISTVSDTLGDRVGQGLHCVFGTRSDLEMQEWTVIWPAFNRADECSCRDDEFHRSWVWPRFKENEQ